MRLRARIAMLMLIVEMAIFLAILLIGYFYAWKRKVLSWV